MARATLLLLHAFPLDARMWEDVRARLPGRPVLAPTLPLPPDAGTMEEWADDVLALTEAPVVPVGVSMGGYLAFELWRRASERVPALVLADTRAEPEPAEGRETRDRTIVEIREGGADALWRGLEDRVLAPGAPRGVRGRARELALGRDPDDLVAMVEAIRDRADSSGTVATIDVPALVVVGEEDALVPLADAGGLANALPGGRLRVIPGAGHLAPLERPESFAAVVSAFLDEVGT
ncbi:MAG TPA: alpha/beta hydrolase [Gaiellaceae bacterium]|nr:alpha/beta hydrolase [Gaiellaceae bacterium]